MRILIAGTGGQGVILAARLLTEYHAARGHQVLSAQLHGMAQRGGAVQASVIIDQGIAPALPRGGADAVLGYEPVETARALPYMSARTVVFMNTVPVVPFVLSQNHVLGTGPAAYPDIGELVAAVRAVAPRVHALDATDVARRAGSVRTLNVVMLGCLIGSGTLPGCTPEEFISTVMRSAPPRLAAVNNRAFLAGVELGAGVAAAVGGRS